MELLAVATAIQPELPGGAIGRAIHSRIELKRREVERFLAVEWPVARFGAPPIQDAWE
jgi:hypothetical protein